MVLLDSEEFKLIFLGMDKFERLPPSLSLWIELYFELDLDAKLFILFTISTYFLTFDQFVFFCTLSDLLLDC